MAAKLKAPWPAFGGKSKVASLIWQRIGDVDNAIEPFCHSAAWLLARPHPPRVETLNDLDCMVANFWRATQQAPEAVGGTLNPQFVEWLMGFPAGWTDLNA